ncbi:MULTISPECIES: hypothetical protein [Cylindrospermopsis]|jgi:hypothetical protein|uniref:Restriction endonuclease subunit R n=1 Tax=Cylindrospermopsis curvispora GIHE-G1 TaxID=2666332 RepID=A0A7H0F2R3_9CYAN|nr:MULTISPECIES: hypothetical protein [Cylindrospermopsis]MBU6343923.1 hypothetical protein [Cyanobacteria bacterium REEB494]KRH97081.1 hypothetical protein ASL19_05075 [Cylindrospermopsis sp. CR12]MCH4904820.1 hypothetical protein [Cylindrospermopsis raciborskii CHAB3438]MEB3146247.1 hypothetical protein [Cylindrospermopsis raciborskii]QNP30329.1 hypothetical protein IAR63_04525 [Cylindrospermopsis curvispora GIHE-G1]
MPYSQFTFSKVKEQFDLTVTEGVRFFPPDIDPIVPSQKLLAILEDIPWAIAVDTEKARSEVIINPVLLELRRIFDRQISIFSGEEFSVDPGIGLTGFCDFLISKSAEQLAIEAPAMVIIEAKKADLKVGIGQCIAEMVAAQRFNQACNRQVSTVYGCISSGTQWRFLQLEGSVVTIDLTDYPLPPVEVILGFLVWMIKNC